MAKQTVNEKKELTAIMDEIRSRTGKFVPQLAKDLHGLGFDVKEDVLENSFFNRPERVVNYNATLVLKIIEVYYHFVDKQDYLHSSTGSSITLLEAVFILSLTHASFEDYWALCELFDVPAEEVKRVLIYVLECVRHKLSLSKHAAKILKYIEIVIDGGLARPWDVKDDQD